MNVYIEYSIELDNGASWSLNSSIGPSNVTLSCIQLSCTVGERGMLLFLTSRDGEVMKGKVMQ